MRQIEKYQRVDLVTVGFGLFMEWACFTQDDA